MLKNIGPWGKPLVAIFRMDFIPLIARLKILAQTFNKVSSLTRFTYLYLCLYLYRCVCVGVKLVLYNGNFVSSHFSRLFQICHDTLVRQIPKIFWRPNDHRPCSYCLATKNFRRKQILCSLGGGCCDFHPGKRER